MPFLRSAPKVTLEAAPGSLEEIMGEPGMGKSGLGGTSIFLEPEGQAHL
jgi:hypothetical protein